MWRSPIELIGLLFFYLDNNRFKYWLVAFKFFTIAALIQIFTYKLNKSYLNV